MSEDAGAALARRALERVQNDFTRLAESDVPLLYVLIHRDLPGVDHPDFGLPSRWQSLHLLAGQSARSRQPLWRINPETSERQLVRQGFSRRTQTLGQQEDHQIRNRFDELAKAAGLAMAGLPMSMQLALWSDAEPDDYWPGYAESWIEGLFDLGWRQPAGLTYLCKRKIWHGNVIASLGTLEALGRIPGIPEPYCRHRWFSVLDDAVRASIAAIDYLLLSANEPDSQNVKPAEKAPPVRDKSLNARDEWIYKECCKLTAYDKIIHLLKKKPVSWDRIESRQGIRTAAIRYAERNGLPPIPRRQGL